MLSPSVVLYNNLSIMINTSQFTIPNIFINNIKIKEQNEKEQAQTLSSHLQQVENMKTNSG